MLSPKYRILITKKCFPKDPAICLGSQLISIVDSVSDCLAPHVWYGADAEAVGKATPHHLKDVQIKKIGTDSEFIEYCREVDQFIWAVFLCIDSNFLSQNIQGIEIETEDKPFRPINVNGALMEIRAFDTTHFALYFDNVDLAEKISKIYCVKIEYECRC